MTERIYIQFAATDGDDFVHLPRVVIRETGEVGLSEYIIRQMREARDTIQ